MVPLTTLCDEYIDRSKLSDKKTLKGGRNKKSSTKIIINEKDNKKFFILFISSNY